MELSRNEKILLKRLIEKGGEDSLSNLTRDLSLTIVEIMNAASWLKMKGILKIDERINVEYYLTDEGKKYLEKGLPERIIFNYIVESGKKSIDDLIKMFGKNFVTIAIANLKGEGFEIENGNLIIKDKEKIEKRIREREENLKDLKNTPREIISYFLKRNIVEKKESVERFFRLTENSKKIEKRDLEVKDEITQLKPEDIQTGLWKNMDLKRYDVQMFAPYPSMGRMHPLSEFIKKVRRIFLNMGFREIYGYYVVSAFWNMDSLFIPQDHPARDMQDTFYVDRKFKLPDYYKTVKKIHENGNGISRGWKYSWKEDLAISGLLRTHTTVNSIKYLYDHRDDVIRVFTVGRVFRRENMDSTHLPEFHQIEGIMVEPGSNFSMLLGTLSSFYRELGFDKIKFKPSYFPYTEPSVEIHVFKDRWIELGGAGVFRPEVTEPLGIKEKVLAWGLGLERLAMLYYGYEDIRDLYIADIDKLRSLPLL